MPAHKQALEPQAGPPPQSDAQLAHAPSPVALALSDVSVVYRGRQEVEAVRGLSLAVHSGERVAVVGPSGCGKSTLLALAAGLLEPTSGTVDVSEAVALMPQRDLLVPWRSALANAAFALEAQGVPAREARAKAAPLFERFGLQSFERSRSWELSGGMRQRVAFLRTMLTGRPLLALDEPFGALDSITRGQMQEWLEDALAEEPRTLLLVTHDVDEALTLADRVIVMTGRPGAVSGELTIGRPRSVRRSEWVTSSDFAAHKARVLEVLA